MEREIVGLKGILYTIIIGFGCIMVSRLHAQTAKDQDRILEAIRSGRLKVTDEMIESQRRLHPELKGMSNGEIRRMLEDKAGRPGTKPDVEDAEEMDEDAPVPEGRYRRNQKYKDSSETKYRRDEESDLKGKGAEPDGREPKTGELGASRFPAGLMRFGYDFFTNNNSTASGGAMPALPEYILSPGDEIQVYTWGRENQNRTVLIDNEGMFHYPPLQPMRLAGMKFGAAQDLVVAEVEKIQGVKGSIGLGKLRSIRVMVLGEVNSPGSYVVSAGATVTTALFQSGGITDIGSLRGIQLRRAGKTMATLDLYDMLLRGNSRGDMQLLAGDAIFVPVAPIQVAITGMIKRPAIYEVKPGTKVLDALELAGGLSSNAFKGRVRLDRVEGYKRKVVLDINMEKVGGAINPSITDGDVLFVDQVLDREYDVVYLKGNVNRPGRFEYKKGMTVKDLIPTAKDLKSETFFKYGHIKRSAEDDERALLLPFSLEEVLEKGAVVPLQPRDTVIIYNRYDIMDQPLISTEGMLRRPGSYPFVDQMRVSDLIIAAGGLTVEAYLQEAHLFRLLRVEENDSLNYTLLKVNLSGIVENPGDENNFELKPFDSLVVFPRSNFILPKKVTINGAVKKGGEFDLSMNMGIRELISQAEGLTRNSYTLHVEVVRRKIVGDSIAARVIHQVSLKDIVDGKSTFRLEDGDGVYIREVVNSRERSTVSLIGEFAFPGSYEFAGGERLSNVIRRAGGFMPQAYLRGAVFVRKSVKDQQLTHIEEIARRLENQMQIMMERTTDDKERTAIKAAIEQRKGILSDIKEAPYLGRVVIHLDQGMAFAGTDWDIPIENGDSLWIGSNPATISIMGEVFSPTNLIFSKKSNTVGKCLEQAGGVNEYGDAKSTYYILPDGTVNTPKNTSFFAMRKVEPGGSIIVPPKGPKRDYLESLAKVTQIIYQIAISVGVAKTLF